MQMLTEQQFEELTKDLPEDGFTTLIPLLMESFGKKRGRNLDRVQVASLCLGVLEMGATIDEQVTLIGELQAQIEELKTKEGGKLWKPR